MLFRGQAYKPSYSGLFVVEFMSAARRFEGSSSHRSTNVALNGTSLPPLRSLAPPLHGPNPPSLIPPIVQKMTVLSEILRGRPAEATHSRVLAIDGLDRNGIDVLIRFLYEAFKARSWHSVRLCTIPMIPLNSSLMGYTNMIIHWNTLWKHFLQVPFPADGLDAGAPSDEHQYALPSPTRLSPSTSEPICINIVPFSPLMITYKMASTMASSDLYTEHEIWRWLAEHWRGMIQPDVTISVHLYDGLFHNRDVVRICDGSLKTLMVPTAGYEEGTGRPFTEKQLRRVLFEVEEWLREN